MNAIATANATPPPDGGWIPTWLAAPDEEQRVQWIGQGVMRTGFFTGGWFVTFPRSIILNEPVPVAWRPTQ